MSRSTPVRFRSGALAVALGIGIAALMITLFGGRNEQNSRAEDHAIVQPVAHRTGEQDESKGADAESANVVKARPAPEFVGKGIAWIIKAQHPNGGWGAGSSAHQDIRDPHAVAVDPATTAFVASALLRAGHTPASGKHQAAVRRATEYLCGVVEEYTKEGPKITDLTGTQIQAKLGPLVDTAMTAQYLARVLPTVPKGETLHARVDQALDKCLTKLNLSQQKDGSWNVGGGWANVLQSSLACSAMEFAQAAGKPIDQDRLDKARKYNLGNYDAKTGKSNTTAAAGVELYAFSSSMRANAAQAKAADDFIAQAKEEGKLAADARVTTENLKIAGLGEKAAQGYFEANVAVNAQNLVINSGPISSAAASTPPVASPVEAVAAATTGPADVSGISKSAAGTLTVSGGSTYSGATAITAGTLVVSSPTPTRGGVIAGRTYTGETAATTEEAILAGFGNNGGEEFLSYMLAAESTVILGAKDWNNWYDKMGGRLSKVQNPDGSWSGHHCITSPVFCTAAVVQTMTADHDAEMLARLAKQAVELAKVDVKK